VIGMALPFAANAAAFVLGAVLIARIATPAVARVRQTWTDRVSGRTWSKVSAGLPCLRRCGRWRSRSLRSTSLRRGVGVLVLYATERLGMSEVGWLLTTAMAAGGVIGVLSYGSAERRFSLGNIMRVGLLIETFTHLARH
jgi:hypothetical protein